MAAPIRPVVELAADIGDADQRFMTMGTLMLAGAYWAMDDNTGYMVGGLFGL